MIRPADMLQLMEMMESNGVDTVAQASHLASHIQANACPIPALYQLSHIIFTASFCCAKLIQRSPFRMMAQVCPFDTTLVSSRPLVVWGLRVLWPSDLQGFSDEAIATDALLDFPHENPYENPWNQWG